MPRIPRPFEDTYGVVLAIAIVAISPFIVITTAFGLFGKETATVLHASQTALYVVDGLSIAGYAFGAFLAGDLIQRYKQRTLFFLCEAAFVFGCALAATASAFTPFAAGRVLLGFATGLLLVIALPPVIQRFPADRMPMTAAMVNIGFFGAVTIGPVIGGAVAYGHAWRWFYAGLGCIGAANFLLAVFSLPDKPPPQPRMRLDWIGLALGLAATALPFLAAGELRGGGFTAFLFMVPLAAGLACFVAMLLFEFHAKEPLSPVKPMWSTLPVTGIVIAMLGGAALVTFMELLEQYEVRVQLQEPLWAGIAFWPEVVGVAISAVLLGAVLRTKLLVPLAFFGMLSLIAGGTLLMRLPQHGSTALLLAATGILGFGAGATVSPGLWMAGFSLPSKMVGRTFALVELVRSEADFILAPVILQVAVAASSTAVMSPQGFREAMWIALLVLIFATLACAVIYAAGLRTFPRADLQTWLERKDVPAFESPALGAALKARFGGSAKPADGGGP